MPVRPDQFGYYNYPFTKVVTGDTNYYTAHCFIFQGTDVMGIPQSIKVIAGWIDSTTQSVRIYDVTNNQTICERADITNEFPSIETMGTLSNLSTGESIWEVQMKRPQGGPAKEVAVASMIINF